MTENDSIRTASDTERYYIPSIEMGYTDRKKLFERLAKMEAQGLDPKVLAREEGGAWKEYDYGEELGDWLMWEFQARSERIADELAGRDEE